jgi:two-component system, cell cycle sensor histidine kinase PleC
MVRANAATAPLRASTGQGIARSLTGPAYHTILAAEPWLRRIVPALIVLFLGLLSYVAYVHATTSRDETLNDAVAQTDVIAALYASELRRLSNGPVLAVPRAADLLEHIVPAPALRDDRQIYLTDTSGAIIAAAAGGLKLGSVEAGSGGRRDPGGASSGGASPGGASPGGASPGGASLATQGTLADVLGQAQPLTVFADRAGVLITMLPDGTRAIATVRNLPAPFGQIAIVQPVAAALADWRAKTGSFLLLLSAAGIVLTGISSAYFWQAWRARHADAVCDKVNTRLNTALSRGRCGLWDWDIARGTLYWSDSMYEMLGYEKLGEYLSFGDVNHLVHPEDGDLFTLADMLAGRESTAVDHAFRIRNAQGEWIWIRARAELVRDGINRDPHLIGIAVDITEQRNLAEATATADLRLRDAIETISEAFVLWDADNRLVMCNSKFQDLHSLPQAALQPGTAYASLAGALTPCVVQDRGGDADLGSRSYEAQLPDSRWLQINERRTKDGGYVSVGTDITLLKRHEQGLLDSERKLTATVSDLKRSRQTLELQTQQLADLAERYLEQKAEAESQRSEAQCANRSKSEFLAKMSHELRTPLNAILGFSEVMEKEIFGALGSDKYLDYCRDIRSSGTYLLALIADILDMSELDSGRIQLERHRIDVAKTIEDVAAAMREAADRKQIELTVDAPSISLEADVRALRKIMLHLIDNAVKFTPAGGHVSVRLRHISGGVNIYVEDSGIGIPSHALNKLGRPFEWVSMDASKPTDGSGLGLAIARSLAELHGGSLRIRSAQGAGTIVMVRLPLPQAQAPRAA